MILKKSSNLPYFDERFVNYGYNKVQWVANLRFMGYRFYVFGPEFGIDVVEEYWGLGIGKAMMKACVQCAQNAGYQQLELEVVAENQRAENMYKSIGFVEYGRNPLGFISKYSGPQELVYMRLIL